MVFLKNTLNYKAIEDSALLQTDILSFFLLLIINLIYCNSYFNIIGGELKWAALRHETPGLKISPTPAMVRA